MYILKKSTVKNIYFSIFLADGELILMEFILLQQFEIGKHFFYNFKDEEQQSELLLLTGNHYKKCHCKYKDRADYPL